MRGRSKIGERLFASVILIIGVAMGGALFYDAIASPITPDVELPQGSEMADASAYRLPEGRVAEPKSTAKTLVVHQIGRTKAHDDDNAAERSALMTINLLGHFGAVDQVLDTAYTQGQGDAYDLVVYVATAQEAPAPAAVISDALSADQPFVWIEQNLDQLIDGDAAFQRRFGWTEKSTSSTFDQVSYKSILLDRVAAGGPVTTLAVRDKNLVRVYGESLLEGERVGPWAVRSQHLTYITENPFNHIDPTDRSLILADLFIDLLDDERPERHEALVRLEDVGPWADPEGLRNIADRLSELDVPFTVAVYPIWSDPNSNYELGHEIRLADRPDVVEALRYMEARGGTLLMHGLTHQHADLPNPYGGTSGEDFEFFLAEVDADDNVVTTTPVEGDSAEWMRDRVRQAFAEFEAAGLREPSLFEFPHYSGSAIDYQAITEIFDARYEQSTYYIGAVTGAPIDYTKMGTTQAFPYPVHDIYGEYVIPENLGNIIPVGYNNNSSTTPATIADHAEELLVVRDSVASFFFHPYLDVELLVESVEGVQALGYTFVEATDVLDNWE